LRTLFAVLALAATLAPAALAAAAPGRLPPDLVRSLATQKVTVVALYARGDAVGRLTRDEARDGARLAGAAFVPLEVGSARRVGALARLYGVTGDPAVLVLARGGRLVATLGGYADRAMVAQAADNAR
jgi:hypothetical protein